MDSTTVAYLKENANELASQLATTYFIDEIVLAEEDDEEWTEWIEEIVFIIEHICYKAYSLAGEERFWFSEEKFGALLDNEDNWVMLARVMHFFYEHDIRV